MRVKDLSEDAMAGTTSSGSVAVMPSVVGQMHRRRKKISKNPSVYGGPTPDNVLFAENSTTPKYKNKQVKGSDSTPSKSKPTSGHETPHPFRGKLVGDSLELKQRSNKLIQEVINILDEKAVSKAQQRFMGMVHSAKKGGKPASKEVAKAAKGMNKKDAKDFASTKHKGLPERK